MQAQYFYILLQLAILKVASDPLNIAVFLTRQFFLLKHFEPYNIIMLPMILVKLFLVVPILPVAKPCTTVLPQSWVVKNI